MRSAVCRGLGAGSLPQLTELTLFATSCGDAGAAALADALRAGRLVCPLPHLTPHPPPELWQGAAGR